MKKKFVFLTGMTVLAAGVAFAAAPQIDKARVEAAVSQLKSQAGGAPGAALPGDAELGKTVVRELQTADVLKNEAFKAGLDKNPEIRAQWENLQAQFYASAFAQSIADKVAVNDADLLKLYDALNKETNLLAIAFPDRASAEAGLSRLKKGLSFENLLAQTDPQAPKEGWVQIQQLPPAISSIAARLTSGMITGAPVELGGHFFLLKNAGTRRVEGAPPFSTVKEQLRQQAKQEKAREQIADILKANDISVQ